MPIGFNNLYERKQINVAGSQLNVRCYKGPTSLLKRLGITEDFSQGAKTLHVGKASLIKQYRAAFKPQGLSDKEIIKIVRASLRIPTGSGETTTLPEKKAEKKNSKKPLKKVAKPPKTIDIPKKEAHQKAEKIIDEMGVYLKTHLLEEKPLKAAIKNQYQMLKLMDEQGNWAFKSLENIGNELVPPKSHAACEQLINEMIGAMKKNPYLLNAIANIPDKDLLELKTKLKLSNGKKLAEYLIPYAFALNSLTLAFAKDVDLFIEIDKAWTKEKPANVKQYLPTFAWIKYKTLGHLSRAKKPIATHKIDKKANRDYLNLNIYEAVLADRYFKKNKDNANAGEVLMKHSVGGKNDPRTGAGRTTVGVTKKGDTTYEVVKLRPDLPKEWADLYCVWNLAFCSNVNTFPILAMKLLIPAVNDYSHDPQIYMHHRIIALYLHFQFSIFRQMAGQHADFLHDGWSSKNLTTALGEANLRSANEYEASVKLAKSKMPEKIGNNKPTS